MSQFNLFMCSCFGVVVWGTLHIPGTPWNYFGEFVQVKLIRMMAFQDTVMCGNVSDDNYIQELRRQRDNEIAEVCQDVETVGKLSRILWCSKVNGLLRDISTLVEEQSEFVETLEGNLISSRSCTEKATHELEKAQGGRRRQEFVPQPQLEEPFHWLHCILPLRT